MTKTWMIHTDSLKVNVQNRLNDSIRIWLHDGPHPNKQTPAWIYIDAWLTTCWHPSSEICPARKKTPESQVCILYSGQTLCTEVQSIRAVFTTLHTSYEIFYTYISRRLLLLLEADDKLCYSPCLSSAIFYLLACSTPFSSLLNSHTVHRLTTITAARTLPNNSEVETHLECIILL
jgi:hypothetical protein